MISREVQGTLVVDPCDQMARLRRMFSGVPEANCCLENPNHSGCSGPLMFLHDYGFSETARECLFDRPEAKDLKSIRPLRSQRLEHLSSLSPDPIIAPAKGTRGG